MAWEKFKNSITKKKPQSFYEVTDDEYLQKWLKSITWEWITKTSQITVNGYSTYVGTCLALNKTSMFGGPLIKSKASAVPHNLVDFDIIEYSGRSNEYALSYDGPGYITVLVRCIQGYGAPRFKL